MRLIPMILAAAALAAAPDAAAWAAGSGGGGGGELPSVSAPRYDPAEEYVKALKALGDKDYKSATRSAQRVTDAAPKNLDAWKLLGMAQAGAQNWKGARRAYERAVKLSPDDVPSHGGLGVALANLKDPKAETELKWLKEKSVTCHDGCNPEALNALIADLEKAIGGEPAAQPSAALERGALIFAGEAGDRAYLKAVSLINEKRYDEALAELDAARAAFGPHPDVLTYQGYVWRKKGAFGRAEAYYREALAIAPHHRGATEYYGELKVERGDLDGARTMLARLDRICAYGCAEAEELRRWIDAGGEPGR